MLQQGEHTPHPVSPGDFIFSPVLSVVCLTSLLFFLFSFLSFSHFFARSEHTNCLLTQGHFFFLTSFLEDFLHDLTSTQKCGFYVKVCPIFLSFALFYSFPVPIFSLFFWPRTPKQLGIWEQAVCLPHCPCGIIAGTQPLSFRSPGGRNGWAKQECVLVFVYVCVRGRGKDCEVILTSKAIDHD